MTKNFPVNDPDEAEHHTLGIHVPKGGVELQLDVGMNLYVYRSTIDGKFVVEIETGDHTEVRDCTHKVQHDAMHVPVLRVMINDWVIDDNKGDV